MDLGMPPSTLATMPWLGFSAGYALSSPIMARLKTFDISHQFFLARMNRVPQFVTFSSIMSTSLLCIGTILATTSTLSGKTGLQATLLTALMVATTAYGLGVGAVPYTMLGEVFTPRHRCCVLLRNNQGLSLLQGGGGFVVNEKILELILISAISGTWEPQWLSWCVAAPWCSSPPW